MWLQNYQVRKVGLFRAMMDTTHSLLAVNAHESAWTKFVRMSGACPGKKEKDGVVRRFKSG